MTDILSNDLLEFSGIDGGTSIYVRDELGGGSAIVRTPDEIYPQRASPEWFPLPVDAAVSFETAALTFDHLATVTLRDADIEYLGALTDEPWEGRASFLEAFAGMKLYVYVDGTPFEGYRREEGDKNRSCVVEFEEPTRVVLGARSSHEQPMATMTVSDDPEDLLEAFSYFGTSIKEWSAERSWPTLRGHPPSIEHGAELDIPASLTKPDTGVTIAVPPTHAEIYRVAPLAFYLGANLVPAEGAEAELRLEMGYSEPLGSGRELEVAVDELLATCLVLDSFVRMDGYYSLPRYEYDEIAPRLHFYPPELYDLSLEERLMEYLETSFADLEPFVPRWPTTGVLRPDPSDAELVPPLLNSLSRVHVAEDDEMTGGTSIDSAASDSPSAPSPVLPTSPSTVTGYTSGNPRAGDALFTLTGFTHARNAGVCSPSEVSTLFVGADDTCATRLDDTSWERFAVVGDGPATETIEIPSRSRLRRLLARDAEFLYYAGHVNAEGFVCTDGVLPFDAVDEVGVTTLTFSGLTDVTPTKALVDAGAAGIAVTERAPVPESVGNFTRYLSIGFPLAQSATLAEFPTTRYVGDGAVTLTKRKNGNVPLIADVSSVDEDTHQVSVRGVLTDAFALGSVMWLDADYHRDAYQLSGVDHDLPAHLSAAEVADLEDDDCIIRLNGDVLHDGGPSETEVRRSAQRAIEQDLD